MNGKDKIKRLTILGLMTAILIIMAYTPLGYLPVGFLPNPITLNMIPIAIASLAMGPLGGAITGGVFGLTSFLQCFGINALGTSLFAINPVFTVIVCFVPRILDGLITGLFADLLASRSAPALVRCTVTGLSAAVFNTLLFMVSLLLLFGNTEYLMGIWEQLAPGKNVLIFACAFVGINAIAEIVCSTLITCIVGVALSKAKLLPPHSSKRLQAESAA